MRQFQPTDRPLALYVRAFGSMFAEPEQAPQPFEAIGPAAVVDIRGPLVQQAGCWLDYDSIARAVRAAALSSARAVILRVDSPGGDALGMGECARDLRAIATSSGKPLIGFVEGMACSAAQALISACTIIITPPAGLMGSVGVYQPMIDVTAADAAMGQKWHLLSSGEAKLDGNPHAPASDAALARTQLRVDGIASLFFDLVAEMRPGVTAAKMRALEGATFLGAGAVQAGLADRVGSWSDVLAMVASAENTAALATVAKEAAMADDMKDDKKSKARKAFFGAMESAFDAMFGDDDDDKKDDPKEEPKKDDKAAASEEPKKDEKKDDEQAKALVALAGELHSLKAERAQEKDAIERARLLALRPDFTEKVRETLAAAPLAMLRTAVETWEKAPYHPAAAASVTGTAGAHGGGKVPDLSSPEVQAMLDEKMGLARSGAGTQARTRELGGFVSTFVPMTQAQAKARLAEIEASGKVA